MAGGTKDWFSVRCVFQWKNWDGAPFEERITLWQAVSHICTWRGATYWVQVPAQLTRTRCSRC